MKKPLKLYGQSIEILNNPEFAAMLGDANGAAEGSDLNTIIDAMKKRFPEVTAAVKSAMQEMAALGIPTEALVLNGDVLYAYAPEVYNGVRSAGYKIR